MKAEWEKVITCTNYMFIGRGRLDISRFNRLVKSQSHATYVLSLNIIFCTHDQ